MPSFVPNKPSVLHFMRENVKNAEQPQKRKFVPNKLYIVFDSNHFNTITYNKLYCVPSFVPNKPSLNHFMLEIAKNAKNLQKGNFARSFKHMTIFFESNHFNTIIQIVLCSMFRVQ